jgi:serine/threonine protein kinase
MDEEYPIKVHDFDINIWRRIILIYKGISSYVFKIQNNISGEYAVLKTYPKTESNERQNRFFYMEVECNQLLAKTHYIVPLWYYYESPNEWGLITKYMSQLTLRSYVHLFPYSDIIMAKVLYPLLMGIYQLHIRGIIHRDLKPDNIFIDNEKIYIGDFGCSHILKESKKTQGIVGTLQYMAPEMLYSYLEDDTEYEYGEEVDIWAIGIITYELFFGKKPFGWNKYNNQDTKTFIKTVLITPLSFPTKIPIEQKDFITQCLTVDPEKRPSIRNLIQHEWVLNYLKTKNDINVKCPQWSFSILALTSQIQATKPVKKKKHQLCTIS